MQHLAGGIVNDAPTARFPTLRVTQVPPITKRRHGRIAALEIASPPINALSLHLRQALLTELRAATAWTDVDALVLFGAGRVFVSGADISELDRPVEPPGLLDIEAAIHALPFPVVASVHGAVLGGGFLLALMCDHRIAHTTARFGFPEVNLGLLPTFAGTQILPRLVGPVQAAKLIVSGQTIDAAGARALGLVDALTEEAALSAGAAFAAAQLRKRRALSLRWQDDERAREDLASLRAELAGHAPLFEAPLAAIDAIERGFDGPLQQAMEYEHHLFELLRASDQSKCLRRLFFAERRASKGAWSAAPPGTSAALGDLLAAGALSAVTHGVVSCVQPGLMQRNRAVEVVRTRETPDSAVAAAVSASRDAGLTCFVSTGRSAGSALFEAARRQMANVAAERARAALAEYGFDRDAIAALAESTSSKGGGDVRPTIEALREALRQAGTTLVDEGVLPDGAIVDALCVACLGWPRYRADIFL